MPPKQYLQLTFGIKVDFFWMHDWVLASKEHDLAGDDESLDRVLFPRNGIANALRDRLTLLNVLVQVAGDNFEKGYQKWTIMAETLNHEELFEPGHGYINLEVASRVMNFDEAGFKEAQRDVCSISTFDEPHLAADTSTGLQVHIGSSNQPYTLPWLKNLTRLVTAFEHEIEALYPDHRVRDHRGRINRYY